MTTNIKSMFSKMNDETREEALHILMAEFGIDNKRYIKNNWLIGGRIPEDYQENIVNIFQNLLRVQHLKIMQIKVQL
ncbi:hypothetical protein ACOCEA_00500 [Maribacter sp. CXY002]|uniref:hypothetical protein n=1 Tax=Maribacter luteocoastalis TaxID=3407671 RepID=UPI003B679C13